MKLRKITVKSELTVLSVVVCAAVLSFLVVQQPNTISVSTTASQLQAADRVNHLSAADRDLVRLDLIPFVDRPVPTFHPYVPPVVVEPPAIKPKPRLLVTPVPSGAAQAYALSKLGPVQFACLNNIVMRESSWVVDKYNRQGSGAYGIPQALPGYKMASAGPDWRTNGVTQTIWMLGYIRARYGSACGAWSYWQIHRSY